VDIAEFTTMGEEYYFVNNMGIGFVTDVVKISSGMKWMGQLAYAVGVLYRMILLRNHQLEMIVDGETITQKNCFVYFCNSRITGGNMLIAPDAKIDDGLLDIVMLEDVSRWELLKAFPTVFDGSHVNNPHATFLKGKEITVRTDVPKYCCPDGEILGQTPLKVSLIPGAMKFFEK
jgi:diacylglycerol kinase family enzyme